MVRMRREAAKAETIGHKNDLAVNFGIVATIAAARRNWKARKSARLDAEIHALQEQWSAAAQRLGLTARRLSLTMTPPPHADPVHGAATDVYAAP